MARGSFTAEDSESYNASVIPSRVDGEESHQCYGGRTYTPGLRSLPAGALQGLVRK